MIQIIVNGEVVATAANVIELGAKVQVFTRMGIEFSIRVV